MLGIITWNPYLSPAVFGSLLRNRRLRGNSTRFKFSPFLSATDIILCVCGLQLCVCGLPMRVWTAYAYVCCVCHVCVSTGLCAKTNHIPKGILHMYVCVFLRFFCGIRNFSLPVAGLSSRSRDAGDAGDPPVHHVASVGPGRAPWRMLRAFKVAKSGKSPRDRFPPS